MTQIIRSPEARADLIEIGSYIAQDSLDAALRLLDEIDQKMDLIAAMPSMGHAREDLHPSLRCFPVGNYLIFYKKIENGIELVRVLHGARDIRSLFGSQ